MKHNVMLIFASLLSLLLTIIHVTSSRADGSASVIAELKWSTISVASSLSFEEGPERQVVHQRGLTNFAPDKHFEDMNCVAKVCRLALTHSEKR